MIDDQKTGADDGDRQDRQDDASGGHDGQGSGDGRNAGGKDDADQKNGGAKNDADKGGGDKGDDDKDGGDKEDGDDKPKKPPVYKRPLFWIILIPILLLLIAGGTLYYLHARRFQTTDDAFVDAHIVRIAAQNPGQLVAVADIDNKHVEAGRLLAIIEPSGPETQLAQAQANVQQARADLSAARAQIDAAIASRQQAVAAARVPLAAAVKARQDLARYLDLLRIDPNAVAGQQLDHARANARQTAADAASARRQINTADAQIAVARRQAQSSQAVIGAREAAVRQANVTLGDLRLTAPVSGQVVTRQVSVGSYVSPGTQLMAIVPDRMWVTANFKETQLELMKRGQQVKIKVDAFPGIKFHGHVDSFQRGAGQAFALLPPQNATGNYVKVVQRVPVRIEFDRGQGYPDPLRYPIGPGMSVVPTVQVR